MDDTDYTNINIGTKSIRHAMGSVSSGYEGIVCPSCKHNNTHLAGIFELDQQGGCILYFWCEGDCFFGLAFEEHKGDIMTGVIDDISLYKGKWLLDNRKKYEHE